MKIIGKLKIIDSYQVTGRGLVARADLIEGKVEVGSFVTFWINSKSFTLRIRGVGYIDNISTGDYWVGLTFFYEDESQQKEIETLKLEAAFIDVYQND
jgi:hypothetical protein